MYGSFRLQWLAHISAVTSCSNVSQLDVVLSPFHTYVSFLDFILACKDVLKN